MSAATRQALDDAIRAHANEEWGGALPVDWVASVALINSEGEHLIAKTSSRENMPLYVTTGLFHEGIRATQSDDE